MLPPQMLSELVLAGIAASLTLGATGDGTDVQVERLVDAMHSELVTIAVKVPTECLEATKDSTGGSGTLQSLRSCRRSTWVCLGEGRRVGTGYKYRL